MMISLVLVVFTIASAPCLTSSSQIFPVPQKEDPAYWNSKADDVLEKALNNKLNTNVANNVILFIADGWDVPTVTAARILKGQLQGNSGEETVMEYEKFPHMGLIKTYSTDMMTSDSSATATAIMSGVKTRDGLVGLDGGAELNNCPSQKGHEVETILHWALAEGKSVGIISTTMVNHATPSSAYAHAALRWWITDTIMGVIGVDPKDECRDITYQLIVNNSNIQVILGGGRAAFTKKDPEETEANKSYMYRSDGLNLIEMWKDDKQRRGLSSEYVTNTGELSAVDASKTDYLLGLFAPVVMSFELDRNKTSKGEPSLAEMTEKAIEILSKNTNGYFLMIEGGNVDGGHHGNMAKHALHESLAFEEAVKQARQRTNQKDTLIVVTSDHAHSLSISGNTLRGNDILGKIVYNHLNNDSKPTDGKPMTVLLYGTGASFNFSYARPDITNTSLADEDDYRFQMAVPTVQEFHTGADVPVFADGPMSHLFFGVQEQNYIAHALAYASCLGRHKKHCIRTNDATILNPSAIVAAMILLLYAIRET